MNDAPLHSRTQCEAILAHMKSGSTITFYEALKLYGCMHLPRRIKDIRECGVTVQDHWVKTSTGKRVKEYWIANSEPTQTRMTI